MNRRPMFREELIRVSQYAAVAASKPVDLLVRAGERIGIAGESGAGKTTLLRWLAGCAPGPGHPARCGHLKVNARVAFIPQQVTASLSPWLRACTQVRLISESLAGEALLTAQLLSPRLQNAFPRQLSGGERQRLLWAQALASRPQVLIADEPTAGLDAGTADELLHAMSEALADSGAALLIASHDESVFTRAGCTSVVRLTTEGPRIRPLRRQADALCEHAVRVRALCKSWGQRPILQDVSLEVCSGEIVALSGVSGSGKSTLAGCLAGRTQPNSGAIDFMSTEPTPRRVQLVCQEPSRSLNARQRVAEALSEACAPGAAELLARFGLPADVLTRRCGQLSEGQRARVAIARHLGALRRHGLLILDESLAALDDATAVLILTAVREYLTSEHIGGLWITHQARLAEAFADRRMRMEDGRLSL